MTWGRSGKLTEPHLPIRGVGTMTLPGVFGKQTDGCVHIYTNMQRAHTHAHTRTVETPMTRYTYRSGA